MNKVEEHDVTNVKIKPIIMPADGKFYHYTDVFITFVRDGQIVTSYSRLAYPIDPKSTEYEKQAFLRRMNRG